ncbi:MAG TPA: capsid cement protein [Aliidongia sp.]|uniref:capsid cement protein n=1 Tax=Aliidongia sp. TaxID=1914230 RepID=UPI002DDCFDEB|nr:capsid cement protein [Aliidongia sp.]HEV2675269.1 capsid cement protein [Aliidongia sp.]
MSRRIQTINRTATGAIASRTIVKLNADGTVSQATGPTDKLFGITLPFNDVADGDRVDVCVVGFEEVQLGGTVAAGDLITSDASGHGVVSVRHTHTENTGAAYAQNATTAVAAADRIIGMAEVAGVAGDWINILLAHGQA